MGVRATLTTSLLRDGELWGLIACHHGTPRAVSEEVRELADWLGQDLSSQIGLAEEVSTRRHGEYLQAYRARIIEALRRGARLADLLAEPELTAILGTVGADGVALIRGDEVTTGGRTPDPHQVLAIAAGLTALHRDDRGDDRASLFATDRLSAHLPGTADLAATAAGVAMFPLDLGQSSGCSGFAANRSAR